MENTFTVSTGGVCTMAITTDNVLWRWGLNPQGQHDVNNMECFYRPIPIMNDIRFVSVRSSIMIINTKNELLAWGSNHFGERGDNDIDKTCHSPKKIMDNIIEVSSSFNHTLAIDKNDVLWSWGSNKAGQLGDGTTTDRHAPKKIMENVVAASTANVHSMALTADGVLWTWGYNMDGLLGVANCKDVICCRPMAVMSNVMLPA